MALGVQMAAPKFVVLSLYISSWRDSGCISPPLRGAAWDALLDDLKRREMTIRYSWPWVMRGVNAEGTYKTKHAGLESARECDVVLIEMVRYSRD